MAFRRMLVSARRIGVPRKTERSDVLWGESLADLFKTSIRLSAKGVKYRDKSRRV